MKNFEKLSVKTIQEIRRIGVYISFVLVITVIFVCGSLLLNNKVKELKASNVIYKQSLAELETLNNSIKASETIIKDNTGSLTKSFMTREEFVTFIGKACSDIGCEILQLQGGEVVSDKNINKINFKFEIRGDINQLYKMMQRIDALNARYAMTSATLRKLDEFVWLDRFQLDSFTLDWWDISNRESDAGEPEAKIVSLDDIYSSKKMALFLNIDFIAADGIS